MSSKHWKYLAVFVLGGFFFAPAWGFVSGLTKKI